MSEPIVWPGVTEHQRETLWLCLTIGQKEAAHQLGITLSTVKNILSSLYLRLGVTSASEAALKLGWLRRTDP